MPYILHHIFYTEIILTGTVNFNKPTDLLIKVPFCGTVKSPKCVTFAPAKHNVKNSVPRTVRWINWNFGFEKLTSQVKSSLLCIYT